MHAGGDRQVGRGIGEEEGTRAAVKINAAAAKFATECDAMEAARRKAAVDEKEDIVNKAPA